MARKGSRKVRTGCLTCKARKVKCDEVKPHCVRCTSTGRKCDGYPQKPDPTLLVRAPHQLIPTPGAPGERRALQYFHEVVSPTISGHLDGYFWTHVVAQLSQHQPAARHATVAISSLFEQLQQDPSCGSTCGPRPNELAIDSYNAAIRRLNSTKEEAVILSVCVLFVCIEFLQGSRQGAIDHCRHGIRILNESLPSQAWWIRKYLLPFYHRLSVFPFFFGITPDTFPNVAGLDVSIHGSFADLNEAQDFVDAWLCRSIRFIRSLSDFRLGLPQEIVPEAIQAEQCEIISSLDKWYRLFRDFESSHPGSETRRVAPLLKMKYLITKMWVEMAPERQEMSYDKHNKSFKSIIDMARNVKPIDSTSTDHGKRQKFIFEMGFLPLLYFVVIKCRCLKLRLTALSRMGEIGVERENLWDIRTMQAMGRRVVELEHSIQFASDKGLDFSQEAIEVPAEEDRIRDSMLRTEMDILRSNGTGRGVLYRNVRFVRSRGFGLDLQDEWIVVSQQ